MAESSSIGDGQINRRGYWTATTPAEVEDLGFISDQAKGVPTLVIPLWGVDGDLVSHQIRPDNPRSVGGKVLKYESPPRRPSRLDVPPTCTRLASDSKKECWITEGMLKADSIATRGQFAIGLQGVWGWRGQTASGGTTELSDWDRVAIKDRTFVIAFDSDVVDKAPVRLALRRLAAMLLRRGASKVLPLRIPPGPNGEKVGIDDYFSGGGVLSFLRESCVDESLLEPHGIVVTDRSIPEITDDAMSALVAANNPPTTFVRDGELVKVIVDEQGVPKLRALSNPGLKGVLARSSPWIRPGKKGTSVEVSPPLEIVEDIQALGSWPEIPPITTVTQAPVLTPMGEIVLAPGYSRDARVFVDIPRPVSMWPGDARSAWSFLITDVLADIPFASPADRAHAVALMMLPLVRPAIGGATPLHLIDAPVQGTGKSLLAKVCLIPTVGPRIAATPGSRQEEEWRKKISSSLLEGKPYVFFDNLSHKVDSESLASVLTTEYWQDRALTTMRNINVPVRCAWVATTNNAEMSRDILRRVLWIRLDARVERPESRNGFKHPDLVGYVSENRELIVSALCRIVQHWVDHGRPKWTGRSWGSYEEWLSVMGGIMQCLGETEFLANMDDLRLRAGTEEDAWAAFYDRWESRWGTAPMKPGDLLADFDADDELAGLINSPTEMGRKTRLGHLLKKRLSVIAGEYKVELYDNRHRSTRYQLVRAAAKPISALFQASDLAPEQAPESSGAYIE